MVKNLPEIIVLENIQQIAEIAANKIIQYANEVIQKTNRFTLVLAGGTTPRALYELLSTESYRRQIDWNKIHLFFGDERFVPPDSVDSTSRMVQETLTSQVDLPPENVHAFNTTDISPEDAAKQYADMLQEFFHTPIPQFDLILLGMGADGHTASLFPGNLDNEKMSCSVIAVHNAPKLPPIRLSLTIQTINVAKHVIFLVAGKDKAETVKSILNKTRPDLPAAKIVPANGTLTWVLDQAANSEIQGRI